MFGAECKLMVFGERPAVGIGAIVRCCMLIGSDTAFDANPYFDSIFPDRLVTCRSPAEIGFLQQLVEACPD